MPVIFPIYPARRNLIRQFQHMPSHENTEAGREAVYSVKNSPFHSPDP